MRTASDVTTRRLATTAIVISVAVVVLSVLALAGRPLLERLGIVGGGQRYRVGGSIDLPPALYSARNRTLFFFSRYDCPACVAAKPALGALADEIGQLSDVTVLLVSDRNRGDESKFAGEIGVKSENVVTLTTDTLLGQRVPAVVLVDRRGVVLFYREGLDQHWDARERSRLMEIVRARDELQP